MICQRCELGESGCTVRGAAAAPRVRLTAHFFCKAIPLLTQTARRNTPSPRNFSESIVIQNTHAGRGALPRDAAPPTASWSASVVHYAKWRNTSIEHPHYYSLDPPNGRGVAQFLLPTMSPTIGNHARRVISESVRHPGKDFRNRGGPSFRMIIIVPPKRGAKFYRSRAKLGQRRLEVGLISIQMWSMPGQIWPNWGQVWAGVPTSVDFDTQVVGIGPNSAGFGRASLPGLDCRRPLSSRVRTNSAKFGRVRADWAPLGQKSACLPKMLVANDHHH